MGKILLFASFFVTLATAAIGFMNKGKLSDVQATLTSTEGTLSQTKTQLAGKEKELKTANDNVAAATQRAEQVSSELTSAKAAADAATAKSTELTTKLTTTESQITQLTADVQAKQAEIDQLKANSGPVQSGPSPEQVAKEQEQATLIAKLQGDLDASRTQLESLVKEQQDRRAGQMKKGLQGRILAVNPAWNFVVLNLGDKNGITSNAEMLIKRGNQLIGKVRITSVEPSTSIADIVANSVPSGVAITPGDDVIYTAATE